MNHKVGVQDSRNQFDAMPSLNSKNTTQKEVCSVQTAKNNKFLKKHGRKGANYSQVNSIQGTKKISQNVPPKEDYDYGNGLEQTPSSKPKSVVFKSKDIVQNNAYMDLKLQRKRLQEIQVAPGSKRSINSKTSSIDDHSSDQSGTINKVTYGFERENDEKEIAEYGNLNSLPAIPTRRTSRRGSNSRNYEMPQSEE